MYAVLDVVDMNKTAVDVELPFVISNSAGVVIGQIKRAERLIVGTLCALKLMLERIGEPVVLVEEGVSYGL